MMTDGGERRRDATAECAPGASSVRVADVVPRELVWIQHGEEVVWSSQTADFLNKEGYRVRFVCFLQDQWTRYRKAGYEADFIGDVYYDADLSDERLREIDRRYDAPSIAEIALSDVYMTLLFGGEIGRKRQFIAKALLWWERFFERHGTVYLIVRDTGSFATRCAYAVGRARGLPLHATLSIGPADGTMMIADAEESLSSREIAAFSLGRSSPVDDAGRARVDALVAARMQDVDKPARIYGAMRPGQYLRFRIKNAIERRSAFHRRDPIANAVAKLLCDKVSKAFWWWNVTRRIFPYAKPQPGEQYVYFPLMFEGEWQNLVLTPLLSHALVPVIEHVAAMLPAGTMLYVKEHPAVPGEFSIRRLRRLQRLPNLRVIDPQRSGQSLIRNSEAVLCAMSTSGWEALLLRKPVIVFGETWYTSCPLAYRVESYDRLVEPLRQALFEGAARYAANEDTWYRFIHHVLENTDDGAIYSYKIPFFSHHNLENSRKIAVNLMRRMEARLSEAGMTAAPVSLSTQKAGHRG